MEAMTFAASFAGPTRMLGVGSIGLYVRIHGPDVVKDWREELARPARSAAALLKAFAFK